MVQCPIFSSSEEANRPKSKAQIRDLFGVLLLESTALPTTCFGSVLYLRASLFLSLSDVGLIGIDKKKTNKVNSRQKAWTQDLKLRERMWNHSTMSIFMYDKQTKKIYYSLRKFIISNKYNIIVLNYRIH